MDSQFSCNYLPASRIFSPLGWVQREFDRLRDALAAQALAGSSITSSIDELINPMSGSNAATQAFLKEFKLSLGVEIDSRFHSLEGTLSAGASGLSGKLSQSHSVLVQRLMMLRQDLIVNKCEFSVYCGAPC